MKNEQKWTVLFSSQELKWTVAKKALRDVNYFAAMHGFVSKGSWGSFNFQM